MGSELHLTYHLGPVQIVHFFLWLLIVNIQYNNEFYYLLPGHLGWQQIVLLNKVLAQSSGTTGPVCWVNLTLNVPELNLHSNSHMFGLQLVGMVLLHSPVKVRMDRRRVLSAKKKKHYRN